MNGGIPLGLHKLTPVVFQPLVSAPPPNHSSEKQNRSSTVRKEVGGFQLAVANLIYVVYNLSSPRHRSSATPAGGTWGKSRGRPRLTRTGCGRRCNCRTQRLTRAGCGRRCNCSASVTAPATAAVKALS